MSANPTFPSNSNPASTEINGVAVGVSVFFVLVLLLMVPIVFYMKRYRKIAWLYRRGPGKREDQGEIEQQAADHRYSTMGPAPGGAGPNPIYENYSSRPAQSTAYRGDAHM